MNANAATRLAAGLLAAMGIASCGGDGSAIATPAVRDSAGIRIVENPPPTARLPRWDVATAPRLDLGGEGDELFRVRGARRLGDGRVVVANGGTNELRLYDHTGRLVRVIGREGAGPGEFRQLAMLRAIGDSIFTYDLGASRVSVFDLGGTFIRSFRLGGGGGVPPAVAAGFYADGKVLGQGFAEMGDETPSGLQRHGSRLMLFSSSGAFEADLGVTRGSEAFFRDLGDGGFRFYLPPFGRSTRWVAAGDRLVIAENDTYEIRISTPGGALTTIVRSLARPRRITPADVERARAAKVREARESDRTEVERVLREIPVPETMPAYEVVAVDDVGNLWVKDYEPASDAPTARWVVFDRDGVVTATATVPAGLTIYQIGADFVLGLWRDELDIEHVRVFDLAKPVSTSAAR